MYICVGLVLGFRHIFKPQNVKCNIFSELTLNTSFLFFRLIFLKKLAENFCVISEIWTELCRITLCWKYVAWNQSLREKPSLRDNGKPKTNFAHKGCLFIKFRKYKTAFNSGLKIWLVSGIFEMVQLFNLKFWLYLWRLGVAFSPHF